ncbi:hypothetical protein WKT22_04239 [Candidatus Lokiarchaeum ossiferum]
MIHMAKLLSDKEQKKAFKKIAEENPGKYYPITVLKQKGFIRKHCINCKKYFWTAVHTKETCGEPECNDGFTVVNNNPKKNHLSFIQVWKKIVEILEPRGYVPIKRYPVVARWNPTTEFTIASIAAFQPYVVSGEVPPPAKKLLIPQFCLRFGDIENVGITGSHCTGFVMIGQHQFVSPEEWDQDQAFRDIYDFLVDGVGLANTEFVIHEDAWAGAGCFGPCMEFFSRGVELFNQVYTLFQQTPEGPIGLNLKVLDMGLGMERVAWFSQGTPNIYEAIFPLVLQRIRERTKVELDYTLYNRFSQFSAFLNIDEVEDMNEAWARVGRELNIDPITLKEKIVPMTAVYSIAEHSRSLLFAITDGKLPSNVGGGYNLRVIFRRAISFIDRFNWDIDMGEVCEWHAEELFEIFPEISESLNEVKAILEIEKQKFYATKKEAEKIVKKLVKKEEITEEKLIELYDSNGINPELIKAAAAKLGKKIKIPDDFYGKVIARHEKIVQVHATNKKIDIDLTNIPDTKKLYFTDYSKTENSAKVLKIQKITHEIEDEEAEGEQMLKITAWATVLDSSIAYPTSGGQLHDNGWINTIKFIDVIKVGGITIHILDQEPDFKEGDTVTLKIDRDRRKLLTQHHTATHIVNAAARKILGNHINQAGAKKTLEKAHLDITHYDSLTDEQVNQIEQVANELVSREIQSNIRFMERSEAESKYGMSLYQGGAVPGVSLRVVEIPDIDIEACGGTHVNNTREIGQIKIIKSQKIQDGIVRLTYTAGNATKALFEKNEKIKKKLSQILEVSPDELVARSQELLEKWRMLRKSMSTGDYSDYMTTLTIKEKDPDQPLHVLSRFFEISTDMLISKIQKLKEEWETMRKEIQQIAIVVGEKNVEYLVENAKEVHNVKFIAAIYPNMDNKVLSNLGKALLKKVNSGLIFLVGSSPKGMNFIVMRGEKIKEYNLSKISKQFLQKVNGKGGGKPDSAQGFIQNYKEEPEKLIEIFQKLVFSSIELNK